MKTNYNYNNNFITPTPKPIEKNPIEKYGAYFGLFMSAIWIIVAIYAFIGISNDKKISKYSYIIPIFLLLLAISNISYFLIEQNNSNLDYVHTNIFHISMIPIYIVIIIIFASAGYH